jgi:Family of unknown function (DUF5631)/Family of unknown function (DUF5632)
MTARQRLRRATRESLATPAFSSPIDCTPWVIGGLWPAELSTITGENATIAEYLKADLQRIADGANEQLKMIKRAGLADLPRQAEEARVIDEARDRAVRRIESTIRPLHTAKAGVTAGYPRPRIAERGSPDMDQTQVIPAVTEAEPPPNTPDRSVRKPRWRVADMPAPVVPRGGGDETEALPDETTGEENAAAAAPAPDMEETQVIPRITEVESVVDAAAESARPGWESVANGRHHAEPEDPATYRDESVAASMEETQIIPAITEDEPVIDEPAEIVAQAGEDPADGGRHHAVVGEPVAEQDEPEEPREPAAPAPEKSAPATGFDVDRLNRLLEFAVRQEPRLNWAVGDLLDGTTVLVTDLAHGWIPAGINLPAGVRLLEPERRTGRVSALIGEAARVVTYAPGDSLRRSADFAATKSSVEPRELPAIEDLGRVLSETTRRFDGLPRIVQRLADAAAADAVVIDQEVDVLRVHLDTARYQLLVQYPTVNPALVLKCLLMAATEGIASGDPVSANYHLAWYQKLAIQPAGA